MATTNPIRDTRNIAWDLLARTSGEACRFRKHGPSLRAIELSTFSRVPTVAPRRSPSVRRRAAPSRPARARMLHQLCIESLVPRHDEVAAEALADHPATIGRNARVERL